MSDFTRTSQGIRNYKLFYSVDVVVFCEGVAPDPNIHVGIDELYWNERLSNELPGTVFRLHNAGSKTAVLSKLKEALGDADLDSSFQLYGCVDADYDDLDYKYGVFFRAGRIFSTKGCDAESDILGSIGIRELCLSLLPRAQKKSVECLDVGLRALDSYMRKLGIFNYHMRRHGVRWFDSKGDIHCLRFNTLAPRPVYIDRQSWLDFKVSRLREEHVRSFGYIRRSRPCDVSIRNIANNQIVYGTQIMPGGIIISLLSRFINKIGETMRPWGRVSRERVLDQALMLFTSKRSAIS